jgi:uncharacterized protein YcbK (DUF882 family)
VALRLRWSMIGFLLLLACSVSMGDLARNFSRHEFLCGCGCGLGAPSTELVKALQELRNIIMHPIVIHSSLRCNEHNSKVGGKANSQHLTGNAADISSQGVSLFDLLLAAHEVDAFFHGGIGVYEHHIHVDVRGHTARWNFDTKKNKPV